MAPTGSYCQLLLATVSYWQLLVATGSYYQPLLATVSYSQLLLATLNNWQLLVATGSYCQLLLDTVSYCQLLLAIVSYCQLLLVTVSYCYQVAAAVRLKCQLLQATVSACYPLLVTFCYCEPDLGPGRAGPSSSNRSLFQHFVQQQHRRFKRATAAAASAENIGRVKFELRFVFHVRSFSRLSSNFAFHHLSKEMKRKCPFLKPPPINDISKKKQKSKRKCTEINFF